MTELGFCYFKALVEALQLIESESAPRLHRRAELFALQCYVRDRGDRIAFERFGRIPPGPPVKESSEIVEWGLMKYVRMKPSVKCEQCERPYYAKGLCRNHYGQRYFPHRRKLDLTHCSSPGKLAAA